MLPYFAGGMSQTVRAAKDFAVGFLAVADDAAPAVGAEWRQKMNRALETVEGVRLAPEDDLERFSVTVATRFTWSVHAGVDCRERALPGLTAAGTARFAAR